MLGCWVVGLLLWGFLPITGQQHRVPVPAWCKQPRQLTAHVQRSGKDCGHSCIPPIFVVCCCYIDLQPYACLYPSRIPLASLRRRKHGVDPACRCQHKFRRICSCCCVPVHFKACTTPPCHPASPAACCCCCCCCCCRVRRSQNHAGPGNRNRIVRRPFRCQGCPCFCRS